MNLELVMDEIAQAVDRCPSLTGRTYGWPEGSVKAPAALVSYPETILRDQASGNGLHEWDPNVVVLIDRIDTRATREKAARFASDDGPDSIPAALEAHTWTTCHFVIVRQIQSRDYPVGNTNYLAQVHRLRVVGSGS